MGEWNGCGSGGKGCLLITLITVVTVQPPVPPEQDPER